MLVLFTGGRGSGKSTIATALYKKLDKTDFDYTHQSEWRIKVNGILKKSLYILYFLSFFRPAICNVFFQRLHRDILYNRAKGRFARIYNPCIFSYHVHKLSDQTKNCVIYESDFITWAADKVLDGIFDPTEVQNYYLSVILPRVGKLVIVVCLTPVEDAFKRWCAREEKTLSKDETKQWIKKRMDWIKARKKVIDIIEEIPNITVLSLNGLKTPLENSTIVEKFLLKEICYSRNT